MNFPPDCKNGSIQPSDLLQTLKANILIILQFFGRDLDRNLSNRVRSFAL